MNRTLPQVALKEEGVGGAQGREVVTVTTSDGVRLHHVDEDAGTPVVLLAGNLDQPELVDEAILEFLR